MEHPVPWVPKYGMTRSRICAIEIAEFLKNSRL